MSNTRIAGGRRTEVIPGGRGVDLRDKKVRDLPIIIPQGTRYEIGADGLFIVDTGTSGATTYITLPVAGIHASEVRIRNKAGGLVYIIPQGASIDGSTSALLMTSDEMWLRAKDDVSWFIEFATNHGYDIAWSIEDKPTASQVILRMSIVRTVRLPASLTGSIANAGTAATAQTDLDIQYGGVSIGTVRFAAAGTVGTFIFAADAILTPGISMLTVVAPAGVDATLAKIAVTFKGN